MRRILGLLVTGFWTAFLGVAAYAALDAAAAPGIGGPARTAAAFGFALAAVLFLWAFATALLDDDDGEVEEVVRLAFGLALCVFMAASLQAAARPHDGAFPVHLLHVAALLVSYVATQAERWHRAAPEGGEDERIDAVVRLMAVGAAHGSMIARPGRHVDRSPERNA